MTLSAAPASLLLTLVAVAAFAALLPDLALIVFAAFFAIVPAMCSALLGWPVRAAETVPMALLAGWLVAAALRRRSTPPRRAFTAAVCALAAVILTSVAVHAALTRVVLSQAGFAEALAAYARTFFDGSRIFSYIAAALPWLAALGLAAVA